MNQFKIAMDRNGNRVVRCQVEGARGFSIQTNGNLPKTHRDGVGPWTPSEVSQWVKTYGTKRQRELLGY